MYGDERPHDKTLKVNTGLLLLFPSPVHGTISLTFCPCFVFNPVCVCVFCVRARACRVFACVPCVCARAPACGFPASQISLNAHCCKAAAECNLTLTL